MTTFDDLIAAVASGKYHRENGPARYWDFGNDSEGVIPLPKLTRMEALREGPERAAAVLRAARPAPASEENRHER